MFNQAIEMVSKQYSKYGYIDPDNIVATDNTAYKISLEYLSEQGYFAYWSQMDDLV